MTTDIWTWLRGCKACGKPHEYRVVEDCSGPPDHKPRVGGFHTWADPDDGHPYQRRLDANVSALQAAYEANQETA